MARSAPSASNGAESSTAQGPLVAAAPGGVSVVLTVADVHMLRGGLQALSERMGVLDNKLLGAMRTAIDTGVGA